MEQEDDPHRLAQRQKQIDIGKATEEYKAYVQWGKDKPFIPVPNKYTKRSKRSWDGIVREWRKRLHDWYNESYVFIPVQIQCAFCKEPANFREDCVNGLAFCGMGCQIAFY